MSTITRGIDGMSLALFTEMTPPPNTEGGGLANALAGSGLLILWATVFGTPLGIANKESLVTCGRLFMDAVKQSKAQLLPVDSEHNAIFQSLPQPQMTSHSARSSNWWVTINVVWRREAAFSASITRCSL